MKTEVNPFKLQNFLSDKCNRKVEDLETEKVKENGELKQMFYIKKFKDFLCEITFLQNFIPN